MTPAEAVAALNAINTHPADHIPSWHDDGDHETHHIDADLVLLRTVPSEVRDAYEALIERCEWWAHA
jgi:hypothetical protein